MYRPPAKNIGKPPAMTPAQRAASIRAVRAYMNGGRQSDKGSFFNKPLSQFILRPGGTQKAVRALQKGADTGVGYTIGIKPSSLIHNKAAGRSMAVMGGVGGFGGLHSPEELAAAKDILRLEAPKPLSARPKAQIVSSGHTSLDAVHGHYFRSLGRNRWKESPIPAGQKELIPARGGAFKVSPQGNRAQIKAVYSAKNRKFPRIEGGGGKAERIIAEPEGGYTVVGGYSHSLHAGRLPAGEGNIWVPIGLGKFKKMPEPTPTSLIAADGYHFGIDENGIIHHIKIPVSKNTGTPTLGQKIGHGAISTMTLPRTLEASVDVSAPLRQGLVAAAGHPKIWGKNFPGMFRALTSEKEYQRQLGKIHLRPRYQEMLDHGVSFTELAGNVSKREEAFMSDLAEKIPVLGKYLIRPSGRAYTGFLDNLRADIYDSMIEADRRKGVNVEDPNYKKGLARYVNAATGRGSLGRAEHLAPALNTVFFSPRLIASRLNFLNPVWYAHLPPSVRKQALKSMATLLVATAGGLTAGREAGGKVALDPRSADFAKLKLGNTRIDPLGGFQQYARLGAQLAPEKLYGGKTWGGKIISSTTGKALSLGSGYGKQNRFDIFLRFLEGKANPAAGAAIDALKGQTFTGKKFNLGSETYNKLTPLAIQDAISQYQDKKSVPLGLGAYMLSAFGVGLQNYKKKPPSRKSRGHYHSPLESPSGPRSPLQHSTTKSPLER